MPNDDQRDLFVPDRSAYENVDPFPQASESKRNTYYAAGRSLEYLMKMEHDGSLGLEKNSVYGAAIAIPQIARSADWPGTYCGITVRSYLFLALNVCLQGFLLSMLGEQSHILSPFAGQMHLCDFGAMLTDCPDGPNCVGPGGTKITYPRLYDYNTWATRNFVRDSLKAAFPDKADEIHRLADAGEYGMEDYYCRAVCCFIFSMAVVNDLIMTMNLAQLLWTLPSSDDTWIKYWNPDFTQDKDHAKKMFGWSELDLVKFGVAGMPKAWKIINVFIVLLPKLFIWWCLVSSGFHFLMETPGIVGVIMNSMAMTFILNLDELIFEVLTTVPVKHIMQHLDDHQLFSVENEENESDNQVLSRYKATELGSGKFWKFLRILFPKRVVLVMLIFAIFYFKYYMINCDRLEDGSWVSKPMHLPVHLSFNPMHFLFALLEDTSEAPFWTMPTPSQDH